MTREDGARNSVCMVNLLFISTASRSEAIEREDVLLEVNNQRLYNKAIIIYIKLYYSSYVPFVVVFSLPLVC